MDGDTMFFASFSILMAFFIAPTIVVAFLGATHHWDADEMEHPSKT